MNRQEFLEEIRRIHLDKKIKKELITLEGFTDFPEYTYLKFRHSIVY